MSFDPTSIGISGSNAPGTNSGLASAQDEKREPPSRLSPHTTSPLALSSGPTRVPRKSFTVRASYNMRLRPVKLPGELVLGLDMDGVLLNDLDYHEQVAQVLCKRYGVDIQLEEVRAARESGADSWSFAIDRVQKKRPVSEGELQRQLGDIERYMHGHLRDRVLICPEALNFLKSLPIKIFIATNRKEEDALAGLLELGLDRLLPFLYCWSDKHRIKPAADMLISATRDLDISDTILFLDDSTRNQGNLKSNAASHGIDVISGGILGPGYGYSKQLEDSLWEAGARLVSPSINHILKDLALRMFGDVAAYQRIKNSMREHHGSLRLPNPKRTHS